MQTFLITTTLERTLSEIDSYRSREALIETPLYLLESRNFHWLELRMKQEMTRIEAIRTHPEPDRTHQWEWPAGYRLIHEKKGQRTEQEIARRHRGREISLLEICGVPLFNLPPLLRRKSFRSFAFQVGRQTKVVTPARPAPLTEETSEKPNGENFTI